MLVVKAFNQMQRKARTDAIINKTLRRISTICRNCNPTEKLKMNNRNTEKKDIFTLVSQLFSTNRSSNLNKSETLIDATELRYRATRIH